LKQSYLLSSKQLSEFVDHAQIDDKSRLQLRFYARQFIDAMSPSKTCNQTVMSGKGRLKDTENIDESDGD
jgi:poly(3-hydroxyalkanoate) synthetase